ncbi:MAG: hypothetical protein A3K23_06335 [Desulfobacca sp. RBG_16_58_9]|nr:MAG: hypothetical protein A3K23_06335 [Desulfobacca sp. RBG_16_58_9]
MSDKVEPKDLEKVLARLTTEWQELADLLSSLGKSQDRVVEVEKILLRDASGQYRGKITADPDGSADLFLTDRAGNAWARLGVNQAGEAFLELKDKNGESTFKVGVGVPSGTGAGPTAAPAPGPPQDAPPGRDANSGGIDRQQQFEPQNRRQKFYWALILVVLGVVLATQAYMLFRPYPPGLAVEALVVRDANGRMRASLSATGDQVKLDLWDPQGRRRATLGLGSEGAPGLAFYDRYHRLRAELNLGPDGEPQFTLWDKHNLQGKTEPNPIGDSGHRQPRQGAVSGSEEGTVASPPAGPAPALSPTRDAEPETEFLGFKRSNKYHYPTCKFLKGVKPEWLIKFKSAADAQAHHYVPCQVCKPPPLSR